MKKTTCIMALMLLCGAAAMAQNVKVEGGKRISQLAGTDALVTVVLKGRDGVEEKNLRIVGVFPKHFSAVGLNGENSAYLYESVELIRVQKEVIESEQYVPPRSVGLSNEEQAVFDRAIDRAKELQNSVKVDQQHKMRLAAILTIANFSESLEYLTGLAKSNDEKTQLDATVALYLAGQDANEDIIRNALLNSHNRETRALAASLAGYVGYHNVVLDSMLHDRIDELASPAARALARLGKADILPKLIEMLQSSSVERNEAAVFALSELGGSSVSEQMKVLIAQPGATDSYKFRAARVLFRLGNPSGKTYMTEIMKKSAAILAPKAALILADEGDWNATQYLYERLDRREDPSLCNLIYRARFAIALMKAGDPSPLSVLQKNLRHEIPNLTQETTTLMALSGERRFLGALRPVLESTNENDAANACIAVVALARPEFHARLSSFLNDDAYADTCVD